MLSARPPADGFAGTPGSSAEPGRRCLPDRMAFLGRVFVIEALSTGEWRSDETPSGKGA